MSESGSQLSENRPVQAGPGAGGSALAQAMEAMPLKPWQGIILGLVLGGLMIDGLATQLLSFVAPVLSQEWGISKAQLGPALAAALIGMALGTSVGGWLGDRFGAKLMLVSSIAMFGVATLATSFTWDLYSMILLRFIGGVGFGAASPNGVALVVDWLPSRVKTRAVMLLSISAPLGGALGAAAVAAMLSTYGWRGCFVATGILSLVSALILLLLLPESVSFLARSGREARAQHLLQRLLNLRLDAADLKASSSQAPGKKSKGWAIPQGYARLAWGSGVAHFCLQFVTFAFVAWAAVFLTAKGFSLNQALGAAFAANISAVVGALSSAFMLDRMGSRKLLTLGGVMIILSYAFIGTWLELMGNPPNDLSALVVQVVSAVIGFVTGLAITVVWNVMAYSYPPEFRASGLGFGMMFGRLGTMTILLGGGWLINVGGSSLMPFFALMLVVAVVAIVASRLVDRHIPAKA